MSEAVVRWASGPVIRARTQGLFRSYEALAVGELGLLGEVIQIDRDEIIAQVYEDTTGLRPGDRVTGTGLPLSVRLGPGILGRIFDGLLRPLEGTADFRLTPGGIREEPGRYPFTPTVAVGDTLAAGQCFGEVRGNRVHRCMLPPQFAGRVTQIAPAGDYGDRESVLELDDGSGTPQQVALAHDWPVRTPRPSAGRLAPNAPMITGQRILDTLFPVARGSRAALPGGFGTGKTILQEALAKWCDADVIVYVGCGERGNEMAEVLDEFPALEDPRTGRPLMERAVIIANTSNMPVAAREASIYTAITVAEYFRDQGQHVALMADSTSRWAEALREVSGRLGELPGEAGYPAYLSARLAGFYERAARVRTLGGDEGSVTIIGAVSPPAGDFSEPVTLHTKRFVRCFWALDSERAKARFYPAIHPLTSYSEDAVRVAPWWQAQGNSEWAIHRERLLTLLEQQARLERMSRIVGKDALPAAQQVALTCADLVNEALLRQSSFSKVDRYCSPERQAAMLGVVAHFLDRAERAVAEGVAPAKIAELPLLATLSRLGEEYGEERIGEIAGLWQAIDDAFHALGPVDATAIAALEPAVARGKE